MPFLFPVRHQQNLLFFCCCDFVRLVYVRYVGQRPLLSTRVLAMLRESDRIKAGII